jgi:small-conductance mechanosensitive channel
MDELISRLAALYAQAGITQLVVLAVTVIVVVAGVIVGRNWYLNRPQNGGSARHIVTDAIAIITLSRGSRDRRRRTGWLASKAGMEWLDMAWTLLALLALIRCSHSFCASRSAPARASWPGLRITLIVWALIATQLLGWWDAIVGGLDSIGLSKGTTRITIWSVMKALATVTVFVVVSVWVARWIDRRVSSIQELAPSTRIGIGKFAYAFLIALGVLLGLQASGVDLTALTVFSGAIGLGLGFGLQSIAANFVSGFVLLMDRSIKPGDVISFTGTMGTTTEGFGWVEELRGRFVVVRDRDGVETLVPNQHLITNPVINWSYSDPRCA